MCGVPKTENTLFGARFLFISTRPSKGDVILIEVEGLLEPLCLHDIGVYSAPMIKGVNVPLNPLWIDMYFDVYPYS